MQPDIPHRYVCGWEAHYFHSQWRLRRPWKWSLSGYSCAAMLAALQMTILNWKQSTSSTSAIGVIRRFLRRGVLCSGATNASSKSSRPTRDEWSTLLAFAPPSFIWPPLKWKGVFVRLFAYYVLCVRTLSSFLFLKKIFDEGVPIKRGLHSAYKSGSDGPSPVKYTAIIMSIQYIKLRWLEFKSTSYAICRRISAKWPREERLVNRICTKQDEKKMEKE